MGRPVTVTVGALASADDNGISTTQANAGGLPLAINGALTDGQDPDSICQSQSPSGSGNLLINGVSARAGIAYLAAPRNVVITSAGDDTGITFTVYGTMYNANGSGPAYGVVETVTGADTGVAVTSSVFATVTRIAVSGASAAAVTVGMNGAATLDMARRVVITSGGDDSGITFAITGTNWAGDPISEVITGEDTDAASSVLDYLTVTSIIPSGATDTTVIVGTSAVASSPWVRFDDYAANSQTTIAAVVSGTVSYSVQTSMDDPNALDGVAPSGMTWIDSLDSAVVSASATKSSFFAYTPVFARVLLNSGTGTVTTTFRQAYLA